MRRLTPVELGSYDHVPPEVAARALVQRVPVLPPGSDGMTLGRLVLVKRDGMADRTGRRRLLAHELVHVRQFAEKGRARFLARYLSDYVRNLARLHRHREAYLAIPYEVEARAGADDWQRARDEG
ncbi:MAG: eCIS core domain-containing protein [Acidimicrobiales bacterium]